ncbi:MAG: disulfide bond formation protein B [Gammaproteobacteria bacterium]|jgi:disulfide bond formation protein DsbB
MLTSYQLNQIAHIRWYWLALLTLGVLFMAVALYYQYVLEELPCVLCIQARIWVSAITVVAAFGLLSGSRRLTIIAHVLTVICSVGLLERSYQLLGTERGFIFGDCGFDPGLPSWFALDEWLPTLFRVETSCGYTPELLLGITMAEGLIVLSAALVLISLTLTAVILVRQRN